MSGSIVPFVKLYDGFYFTDEKEPCLTRYAFEKSIHEKFDVNRKLPLDTFEEYIAYIEKKNEFKDLLKYEPIQIIEKEDKTQGD